MKIIIALTSHSSDDIEAARKHWLKDLKSSDAKTALCALVAELVFLTNGHYGMEGATAGGESTYGISTLRAKHIKVTKQGVTIGYIGKKGIPQKHKISSDSASNKTVIGLIIGRLEGKDADDAVFAWPGKNPIKHIVLHTYLKGIGFGSIAKVRRLNA